MLARRAPGSTSTGSPEPLGAGASAAGAATFTGLAAGGGAGAVVGGAPTASGLASGSGTTLACDGAGVAPGVLAAVETVRTGAEGVLTVEMVPGAGGVLPAVETVCTAAGALAESVELDGVECLALPPPATSTPAVTPTAIAHPVSATTSHVDSFGTSAPSCVMSLHR